ncbi:MAG: hypothetical protein Aurels2KO_01730 [Aureliella sp.]
MIVPYSTDAPLYHYPITTVSLIVINCLVFGYELTATREDIEPLILQFGQGWIPWQWVSSMFLHGGPMHLIGNMIFLWAFGLVVEGKVGSLVFAGLYLGLGIAQAAVTQTLMLFAEDGGALGASGAIFAVLALVVVFAPVNSFDCFLLILFRAFTFEMPILAFGFFYFAWNAFFFFVGGATMSSEALHLIGFFLGAPVGLFLVTRGYVDCEGFDIVSHLSNQEGKRSTVGKKHRKARRKAEKSKEQETAPSAEQIQALISSQIDNAIDEGNVPVAVALEKKLASAVPGAGWKREQLGRAVSLSLKQKDFAQAEPLLLEHVDRFEQHRFEMQVYLLKIWLKGGRPRHALRFIQAANGAMMSDEQNAQLAKLARIAKKQIADGVLEVE